MNFVGYSEMESVIWLKNISNMIPCQICLKKEKKTLHKLITKKNCIHVINDMDKNLGPANADKSDVIKECKRQLYDVDTYLKLSKEEWKNSGISLLFGKLFAKGERISPVQRL